MKRQQRRLSGKMLGIGDGANDVAMIQAADVGVGIMGKEGRQVHHLWHILGTTYQCCGPGWRLLNSLSSLVAVAPSAMLHHRNPCRRRCLVMPGCSAFGPVSTQPCSWIAASPQGVPLPRIWSHHCCSRVYLIALLLSEAAKLIAPASCGQVPTLSIGS